MLYGLRLHADSHARYVVLHQQAYMVLMSVQGKI